MLLIHHPSEQKPLAFFSTKAWVCIRMECEPWSLEVGGRSVPVMVDLFNNLPGSARGQSTTWKEGRIHAGNNR